MAIFRVAVTAKASTKYMVEIDAKNEREAMDMACRSNIYAVESGEDFQVAHNVCTFETEAEQLTAECPDCGISHSIPHDDLRVCHCGVFGFNPYAGTPENPYGRVPLHPHIIVDGVCTPEPWWYEDQDYCAACGAKIEAAEAAHNAH
jgi:hypothetical protein